ncbi:MAG: CO dehydrogenase/acetyl-CoA synthase subunit delta [Candidatus Syntropharchaeia archaeon]
MAEKKKIVLKKKDEGETEKKPSEGKEIFMLISRLGRTLDRIECLKGVDLEFDEIILEGVMPPYELLAKLLSGAPAEAPPAAPPKEAPKLEEFKFKPPLREYKGKFEEVTIGATKEDGGTRDFTVTIGGSTVPPLYAFEGDLGRRPVIAHCVFDEAIPLPRVLKEYYEDVVDDPVQWAKKSVDVYGAKMIWLDLNSTDPKGSNRSAEEAAETVKEVLKAVGVPIGIGVRSGDMKKDVEVIERCAEAAAGENVLLFCASLTLPSVIGFGMALADEIYDYYKAAAKYNHCIASYQPMNTPGIVTLNKTGMEVGVPKNKIVVDPGLVAVGYGTEVAVSTIDALYSKAFIGDEAFQMPIIGGGCNAWLFKESYLDEPAWGSREHRGHAWELATTAAGLLSGLHLVVMLDQYAIEVIEGFLDRIYMEKIDSLDKLVKYMPGNNCKKCLHETCADLASAILEGKEEPEKCEILPEAGVRTIKRLLNPTKEGIPDPSEISDWIKAL